MSVSKTSDHIQIKIKMPNPSQKPPASSKASNQDLKDMDVLCTFKIKIQTKFRTCVNQRPFPIKVKMPNPSQESPVSSKAENHECKDMDTKEICNFKNGSVRSQG